MATFIRNHPTGSVTTAGTTVATALSADVPAGRTLIATFVGASAADASSISKPVAETGASWTLLRAISVTTGDGVDRATLNIWAIKTTVEWSNGQTITATTGTSGGRQLGIAEFDGVSVTVVSSDTDATNERSSRDISVDTDETLRAGDVSIQATISQFASVFEASSAGTASGTRQSLASGTASSRSYLSTAYLINGSGGRSAVYGGGSVSKGAVIIGLRAADYPPNTPVLTTNASGGTLDRGRPIRLGWGFSSPNAIDSQSAYQLRYRPAGDTAWTATVTGTTSLYRDFTAGTFAAGDWEWQVQYNGALGKPSGWSDSGFFTAADQPDGPTITYPISGQMLEQFETTEWSAPDGQDAYQLRRVADDAGDPDPDTIYQDTGEVAEPLTRALALNFSVNNRAEHIQLRVKVDDLWSEWDDVQVDVSYTPPPTPTRTLYPDAASFLVVIANPDPAGDDPAAVSNNVWIDDGKGLERRAVGVPTNGSWVYETPISGRDYGIPGRFVVEAVAANGTTARST